MSSTPKVGDIDDEDNILTTKIKLTKNEYNATIRNKLEYNRLKVIKRHITDQKDMQACRSRTSLHDLRKWLNDNQQVVCNIDEFFLNRKVQSAGPRLPGVSSSFARPDSNQPRYRGKSASTLSRPYTAPLQTVYEHQGDPLDGDSDDEIIPISISRLTSAKPSVARRPSSVISSSALSQQPTESNVETRTSISHRITWPVKLKVFTLQDEDESRKQYLAWRAEQRKNKVRRPSKTFFDSELEQKYRESIRRRQEIEAYVTPESVEEHKLDDPIFAKRYRQLKLAVRAGKLPNYDVNDREINTKMTKSKIERARSAMITAKQSKIKSFYRHQQSLNDTHLSHRIKAFVEKIKRINEDAQSECEV